MAGEGSAAFPIPPPRLLRPNVHVAVVVVTCRHKVRAVYGCLLQNADHRTIPTAPALRRDSDNEGGNSFAALPTPWRGIGLSTPSLYLPP